MEFLAEFHPPVVHFAIALVIMGVLFDIAGFVLRKESLKHAGFWSIMVGVVAVWGAAITGHQAEELVEHAIEGTKAYEILEEHEELGEILPWVVSALGFFRLFLFFKENNLLFIGYLIAGLIVSGAIGLQGRIGGKLVYEYGVGVKANQSPSYYIHEEHEE
ncbi:MAG: DUF2231 domain-containing protein [Aquificae bacterium]|nr:DUF2231 domain-containing protein [Aquificota bacterium]